MYISLSMIKNQKDFSMKTKFASVELHPPIVVGLVGLAGFVSTATGMLTETIGFSSIDSEIVFAAVCLMSSALGFYAGISIRLNRTKSKRVNRYVGKSNIVQK